jgi:CRISPR-associated protein Csd1
MGRLVMLDLIQRYALAREKELDSEDGFATKRIKWLLVFMPDGKFTAVSPAGTERVGKEFARCPNIQSKTGKRPLRDFLVDTADHVALFSDAKSKELKALQPKHDFFVDLLEQAKSVIPELATIAQSLRDKIVLERIREQLQLTSAKGQDLVTLAIQRPGAVLEIPLETAVWHDWWRSKLPEFVSAAKNRRIKQRRGERVRCLLTGHLVEPELTHGQVSGLPGGRSSGMSVVSFDDSAFQSYGFEQSENADVGSKAARLYVAGLQNLIDTTGQLLANVKVIHWYAGRDDRPVELRPEDDPQRFVEEIPGLFETTPSGDFDAPKKLKKRADPDTRNRAAERDAQRRARTFLRSVRSGDRPDLAQYRYYSLTLSGSSARVVFRDIVMGQFGDLCEAVAVWFDDFDICHRDKTIDGLAASPKFSAVLGAMVRDSKDRSRILKDVAPPVVAKLWRCAMQREPIPEPFAVQALNRATVGFINGDAPNHARMGLLRAYLRRKGDQQMTPFLNIDHPDPAYHCGRLLAVLDDIQYAALGDVGAGVVQRYYAAASATPALVLGRLVRLANTGHLPKVDYDRRQRLEQRLASVWGKLRQDPPITLSLSQQTLFAMGYYQQKASD